MAGVNKVILVGHLGKDPETRKFDNGNMVANFSVATSEKWNDKTTGETKEVTEWHNIVMMGKLAEIAAKYLTKGSQVYLEGKLRTRSWEKDGITRYVTEVVVDSFNGNLTMLGSNQDNQQSQPKPANQPTTQPANDEVTDDLPF